MSTSQQTQEYEFYFSCTVPSAISPEDSIASLKLAYTHSLLSHNLQQDDIILQQFFCSDVYTQRNILEYLWPVTDNILRIYIGQEPLDSSYISVLTYAIKNVHKHLACQNILELRHGIYTTIFSLHSPSTITVNAEKQSDNVITDLQKFLHKRGMSLERHVHRTWYYVRDIDNNYAGMVHSRVRAYEAAGLMPTTHFISSTGIEAQAPNPHALVTLRSQAISGLKSEQVSYLKALDFLSPTHAYGVNFERATRITYGDRQHCHISGTASIDSEGRVLHNGDVVRQCERAVRNIEALLHEGSMELRHMASAIVYLRDGHDYGRIAPVLHAAFPPECALIVTRAAVCRPDWLIEIEGEAVAQCDAPYPNFV